MARAINQATAWITALFFSLVLFGLGLAIVFKLKPKNKDGEYTDHEVSDSHQEPKSDEHSASDLGHGAAPSKSEHSDEKHSDTSYEGHENSKKPESSSHNSSHSAKHDVEITPESVKAKAESHK